MRLASESVEGSSLSLESVDDVKSSDGLSSGVFSVGYRVTDDVLQEGLENSSGLLIDESGNSLDTSSSGQSSDGGLSNTLDVVSQYLAVALSSSLSKSLSSFSSSSHFVK